MVGDGAQGGLLALHAAPRGGNEPRVSPVRKTLLAMAAKVWRAGVADVGQQHADDMSAAALEHAGKRIWVVVEFLDRTHDAFACFTAHVAVLVDGTRDRHGSYTSASGNIANRGLFWTLARGHETVTTPVVYT